MIIGSTYDAVEHLVLPQSSLESLSESDLVQSVFHALYLKIFLPSKPEFTTIGTLPDRVTTDALLILTRRVDPVMRDAALAVLQSGTRTTTSDLLRLAIRSGFYHRAEMQSLCHWVIIAYGDTFTTGVEGLTFIPFDECGNLYPVSPRSPLRIDRFTASEQRLNNLTPFSPFYRWLSVITQSVLDQAPETLDDIFAYLLPMMSAPLSVGDYVSGKFNEIPLTNFVFMFTKMDALFPSDTDCLYSRYRCSAWIRFFGFGESQVCIENGDECRNYFTKLVESLTDAQRERLPLLLRLVVCYHQFTKTPNPYSNNIQSVSASLEGMAYLQTALEAADLIGDGSPSTNLSDDDDPDNNDTATGDTNTAQDTEAETDGADPNSIVQSSPQNQINNNSIGEPRTGSRASTKLVPENFSANTPEVQNQDYFYLLSVCTLNSRLRNEPDLNISTDCRDVLESWCRYEIWIYPASETKKLIKSLGLTPLMSSLS